MRLKCFISVMLVILCLSPMQAATLCERLIKSDKVVPAAEHKYLLQLCNTSIEDHDGPLVSIESGFLPLPDNFYAKIPERPLIVFGSAVMPKINDIDKMETWPYGLIEIGDIEQFQYYERPGSQNVEGIETSSIDLARRDCGKTIDIVSYERSTENLSGVYPGQEIRIGDTGIVLLDGTVSLATVLVETYARLNCRQDHQDTQRE